MKKVVKRYFCLLHKERRDKNVTLAFVSNIFFILPPKTAHLLRTLLLQLPATTTVTITELYKSTIFLHSEF